MTYMKDRIQKLKSEHPDFFEQCPLEFLKFVFSEELSSKIAEICIKNGVEDEEKIEKIAYRIALVLLNQLAKENKTFTTVLIRG